MIYFIITLILMASMFFYFKSKLKEDVDISFPTTVIPKFTYKGRNEFNTKVLALLDVVINEGWGFCLRQNWASTRNHQLIFFKNNVDLDNIPSDLENLYLILEFNVENKDNKFKIILSNYGDIFEFGDGIRYTSSEFRITNTPSRFTFNGGDVDKIIIKRITNIIHHYYYNDMILKYENEKKGKISKISNLDKALTSYFRDKKIDDILN